MYTLTRVSSLWWSLLMELLKRNIFFFGSKRIQWIYIFCFLKKETWPYVISNHNCFIFRKINPETKFNDSQHVLVGFQSIGLLLFYCSQRLEINHSANWDKHYISAQVWYSCFVVLSDDDNLWGESVCFGILGMWKG